MNPILRAIPSAPVGHMTTALIEQPGVVRLVEQPLPDPEPGQVRIRVDGCGVCGSNVPPWEGRPWFKYPLSPGELGHEGWGRIDAIGDGVLGLSQGDHVAFLSNHAFAEYDVVDAGAVVKLPPDLAQQPFPAEPLACAMNVFRRAEIEAGQTVAIVGIGFLGALLTQMCARAGARVIAFSRRPFALQVARQMGAETALPLPEPNLAAEQVKQLSGGALCPRVIECTGKQAALDVATSLCAVRGRLVIAGFHQDGQRQVNMQTWNWHGLDVINAHERDPEVYVHGMRLAVEAVAAGQLDPTPLYTHTFPLDQLDDALNATTRRPHGFMKALVTMNHPVEGRSCG